jgi:hypothetical protein
MKLPIAVLGFLTASLLLSGKLLAKTPTDRALVSGKTASEAQTKAEDTNHSDTAFNAGETIDWEVIAGGGGESSSGNLSHLSTVGQSAVGEVSSSNFHIVQGFLQNFGPPPPTCVPGDADGSTGVDIDDVVYLISYIFSGGPPPTPDLCCGDADGSGAIDIDDVVYLISYIFSGGPPPVEAC